VVQHCPLRGGLPGGFHCAVGGSCAGLHCAGVRRRDFRLYSRLVTVGLGVVALLFGSALIDYWTIMRFFGSRGGGCLPTPERTRFFRAPCRFTCSTYLSIRKYSGLCLRWRLFAPLESCSGTHLTVAVKYRKYDNISLDKTS